MSQPPDIWSVKLADFGISKRAEDREGTSSVKGTLEYMAPERLGYHSSHDSLESDGLQAADMWALGATTYLMLTGEHAFKDQRSLGDYAKGLEVYPSMRLKPCAGEYGTEFILGLMVADPNLRMSARRALDHPWMKLHENESENILFVPSPTSNHRIEQLEQVELQERVQPELTDGSYLSWNTASNDHLFNSRNEELIDLPPFQSLSLVSNMDYKTQDQQTIRASRKPVPKGFSISSHLSAMRSDSKASTHRSMAPFATNQSKPHKITDTQPNLGHKTPMNSKADYSALSPITRSHPITRTWQDDEFDNCHFEMLEGDSINNNYVHAGEPYSWSSLKSNQTSKQSPMDSEQLFDFNSVLTDCFIESVLSESRNSAAMSFPPNSSTIGVIDQKSTSSSNKRGVSPKRKLNSIKAKPRWKRLQSLKGHGDIVYRVTFSPDGKLLASASYDGTIKIWDTVSGEHLRTMIMSPGTLRSLEFSPDGELLASGCHLGDTIQVWDVTSGSLLNTLTEDKTSCRVIFSPVDNMLVSVCGRSINFRDARSGKCWYSVSGHSETVNDVAFSLLGNIFASASSDGYIKLWNARSRMPLKTISGHLGIFSSMTFSLNGKLLASSSKSGLKVWDVNSGEVLHSLWSDFFFSKARYMAFLPDGNLLAATSISPAIKLWEPYSGKRLWTLRYRLGTDGGFQCVTFSPDGRVFVAGVGKGIRLWSVDS
jgi:WD40 repeat protein